MNLENQKALLFGSAAAIRLLLFAGFPSLPTLLTSRVEISTPVTSFKRLQEGLYLYNHNVPPYDGGVFHQAPLLLPLFSLLPDSLSYPLPTSFLYLLADLLAADALIKIADTGESASSRFFTSPRKTIRYNSIAIGASYLFNPLLIATCIGRPSSVFTNALVLLAISAATRGRSANLVFTLSLASYFSLYPILLFPPLLILCYDAQARSTKQVYNALPFAALHLSGLLAVISALLYMSYLITGSWQFLRSTYGVWLLLPDLTPNSGLWWYFFTEMFDSFREFFLGVFWLHMASYVGGFSLRLRTQPLFAIVSLLGIFAIFMPYPSVAESGLFLSVLPLYRHVFPLMRYTFITSATLLYATLLGPAFYYLWIYAGSGNANFFYAITLVWSLGLSMILADCMYAVMRDEWEVERPEMKGKEAVRI